MDAPLPDNLVPEWERFFENTPVDYSTGIFENGTLFPLQRRIEMKEMLRIAMTINPKTVMEIGADKGGSLYHWAMLPTVRHVIACEIRGTPYDRLFEQHFPTQKFKFLPASSYAPDTIQTVKAQLDEWGTTIDCLFIDGDKSCFDTDFWSYLPMLSKTSLAFFHDIQDGAPGAAFRTVAHHYPNRIILNTEESAIACEKERAGIPCPHAHEAWLRYWKGRSCGVGVIALGGAASIVT